MSHYDFFSPEIRRSSAFSLLTPASAAHPPHLVGGLELWPWSGTVVFMGAVLLYSDVVHASAVVVGAYDREAAHPHLNPGGH